MSEPVWIKNDVVLAIHRRQLAEHGGGEAIRDSGLLESALSKPKNLYHYRNPEPDLALLAASYAYGIAKNHPFVDGNKRTAFVVCRLFLKLNGTDLTATQEEKYNIFLKLAAGDLSEQELADWITRFLL
ncbi:MAG: type II toxin-antitoxin system death-on-curing family toxin [Emcibacter sp.]|nr:type II toxin-antitoxin system death-on-curing family toxin [Emcibacter sp.]